MALQTKTVSTGDYAWHSWSNGYVISLTLTEEATDLAANTSLVSYLFTISNTNNNRFYQNGISWTISIGGQEIAISNFNFDLSSNYTTQTIASGQITVLHNPDGSMDMPYNVSVPNVKAWNTYGPPAMSLSGTWTLTRLYRMPPVLNSISIKDGNGSTLALTGNSGQLVRYCSKAVIQITATATDGLSVTRLSAICGDGKQISAEAGQLQGTIENVESGSFTIKATDSAGNTTEAEESLPMVEYVKLTCNLEKRKPDTEGNMTLALAGNYFGGSFGAASNSLRLWYRYKVSGTAWLGTEEEWQEITPVVTGNSYTAQGELTGLDYQTAYTFQAKVTDALSTVETAEYTARATPVFDWGENDFRFNVPVSGITADMVGAKYVSNDGALLLSRINTQSGLIFIRDGGNLDNYYLGVFVGYQSGRAATFHTLSANNVAVITNRYGSVSAINNEGEATYVIIPFTTT